MARRLKNIRPWKGGWQAYTEIAGTTYSKSYPLTATPEEMRAWITEQRGRRVTSPPVRGSFGADIASYLSRVSAMPTYAQRAAHLELWARALGGDRPRRGITTADVDRVLQGWLLDGLAPATVKKRRMALLALFHKLDGKEGSNPVRASAAPREPKPEARSLSYETIQRLLDAMQPSKTKARIAVLAWTGLPPGMLQRIRPPDLDLEGATVRVRPRRKGAGVEARTLPLLPQAVDAFRAFHLAGAYGPFSVPTANTLFKHAGRRAVPPVTGIHLYLLRHSFGTMLYRVTKDLATVSRFLLHSTVAATARYAAGAMAEVDRAAAAAAGKANQVKPVPDAN